MDPVFPCCNTSGVSEYVNVPLIPYLKGEPRSCLESVSNFGPLDGKHVCDSLPLIKGGFVEVGLVRNP